MPKAYWIVNVSVHDPEHYPEYLAVALPVFEAAPMMRWKVRRGNAILSSNSGIAAAMACYQSPEYQQAVAIR
jgi:uncharacterized protein (DUF1330 family)